jgi:hypothetical protein
MAAKKASQNKKEKKVTKATKKTPVVKKKPVVKKTPKAKTVVKKVKAPVEKIQAKLGGNFPVALQETVIKTTRDFKIPEVFKNFYSEGDRVFLRNPKKFAGFPDLLDLQKRGYDSFIKKYINKIFQNINHIWDIAGEKMYVEIDDVKILDPIDDSKTCKKKELTYGSIITAKVKLNEVRDDGKKKTEKTLFSKRANIGILPLMTPSASYIINGVERVIISQIIRSYGIFFAKKEFRFSFKVIPENGPWLEIQTEKS